MTILKLVMHQKYSHYLMTVVPIIIDMLTIIKTRVIIVVILLIFTNINNLIIITIHIQHVTLMDVARNLKYSELLSV